MQKNLFSCVFSCLVFGAVLLLTAQPVQAATATESATTATPAAKPEGTVVSGDMFVQLSVALAAAIIIIPTALALVLPRKKKTE